MDSNESGFLLKSSTPHSAYYQGMEENGVIDLGLSLRTLQPETYHPSDQMRSLERYPELTDWPNVGFIKVVQENGDEDSEGVQIKGKRAYVKVNMDGVMVGRKVCILDQGGYSSLAYQLENMFGLQSVSGLRLFQGGSEFTLFYRGEEDGNWRIAGDVPWMEFVGCVKRLRIARRNGALGFFSSSFT